MIKESNTKKKVFQKKTFFSFFLVLIIVFTFAAGFLFGSKSSYYISSNPPSNILGPDQGKPADVDFALFWQSWNELTKNYVGDLNPQNLVYGAIDGMLAATKDPYTMFLKPEDNKKFQDDISGEFTGIGVEIMMVKGLPTVVAPLSGSPAEKAGLKGKDVIAEINSEKTDGMGFETVIDKIRGDKGSTVKLKIIRAGSADMIDFDVVREIIKVKSVETQTVEYLGKKVYYIKVRQFGDDTNELFAKAVSAYKNSGANLIVLDLRNNPGGYLDGAVDLASYFLDGGVVVSEIDRDGNKKDFKTSRNASLKDVKLAVLVNEGSASASEIFAGAMKDRNRAKIIGAKTFGKGSVQVLEQLQKNSAIKITIAKWATPNGDQIDGKGIIPDFEVKDEDTEKRSLLEDSTFQKAVLETK